MQNNNDKLKNILVIGTGGTIAGKATSALQTSGYKAGAINVDRLLATVPGIYDTANIITEDYCKMDSVNMNDAIRLPFSKYIQNKVDLEEIDAVVIAHGTDTLEETAYFLNLTVRTKKTIIVTGAMIPATAVGADGPLNLKNSIYAASSGKLNELGVIVCLDQGLISARNVTKTNAIQYGTFTGRATGYMGYVTDRGVEIYQKSIKKHTFNTDFDLTNIDKLPKTEILYTYGMDDVDVVDYYVNEKNIKGLIIAAAGDGSIPDVLKEKIYKYKDKVIFARASRTGDGVVIRNGEFNDDENGTITANNLNPQKARILLSMALTKTKDVLELQKYMDEY